MLSWVQNNQDEVIIESHGEPAVVVMYFAKYEKVKILKEQERRTQALERLRRLRSDMQARNKDLTPEEGDALADRFSREIVDDMVNQGKIRHDE